MAAERGPEQEPAALEPSSEQERRLSPQPPPHPIPPPAQLSSSSDSNGLPQSTKTAHKLFFFTQERDSQQTLDQQGRWRLCYQMEKGSRSPIKVTLLFRDIRFLMKSGVFRWTTSIWSCRRDPEESGVSCAFTFYFIFLFLSSINVHNCLIAALLLIINTHRNWC